MAQLTRGTVILETRTRLDLSDLAMWRAAGLKIDEHGLILPSSGSKEGTMKDDMISNALLWILAKIFNYIADTEATKAQSIASPSESAAARSTIESSSTEPSEVTWKQISHELNVWYDGLPDWFHPCARITRSASEPATASGPPRPVTIPDIWFTSAMCASTIQTYHLARILMLVNKPRPDDVFARGSSVFKFLRNYRSIEAELQFRSREIFGIAISSPTTSIELHQTQTIFIAAQCLVDDEERCMALDILRRVNSDLGWETDYRVQQLLREWGWEAFNT